MSAHVLFSKKKSAFPGVWQCADGYVRLGFQSLIGIELQHLVSGLDDDPVGRLQCGNRVAAISGFTEWVSDAHPRLTIGWDWIIGPCFGAAHYQLLGKPRSNIMLVDDNDADLGPARTEDLLIARLALMNWQDVTARFITSRYI